METIESLKRRIAILEEENQELKSIVGKYIKLTFSLNEVGKRLTDAVRNVVPATQLLVSGSETFVGILNSVPLKELKESKHLKDFIEETIKNKKN